MIGELLVILLLVLVNGILAGAEIAIVGVERARLKQLEEEGDRRVRFVEELRRSPERFFASVQLGITVIGATAGAFGGSRFARHLEPLIGAIGPLRPAAPQLALVVVVAVISFLSVVFGELVPKSLALRHSAPLALAIAPIICRLSSIARPFVWLFTVVSNKVLSLFGDHTTFVESRLSPTELQHLVNEAAETGSIPQAAGEIASRALEFAGLDASRVMVPRARVVGIPISATPADVQRIVLEHGYSRFPVYGDGLDHIEGYVLVKDLLAMVWERQLFVLDDLVRPAYFVVESASASDVLQEMRRRRVHLGVVVDEHGGTSGIVTIEDLLEELVGEIFSELAQGAPDSIRRFSDGSAIVSGDTPVRDINRELGIKLPESDEWSTIGGLCFALAERVPKKGEALSSPDGTRLEIESAKDRSVVRVRLKPMAVESGAPA